MDFRREHGFAIENVPNLQSQNSESFVNKNSGPVPVNQEALQATKDLEELSEPREVYQIPVASFRDDVITQGSRSVHQCRKYLTEEGCPYGLDCVYLHYDPSQERPSDAIILLPGTDRDESLNNRGQSSKSNGWKFRTLPCRNWERSGHCPYGSRCCFIHRVAGANHNDEGLVNQDVRDRSLQAEAYVPSRSLLSVIQNRVIEKPTRRWKGPNKISKIYGDWIDDL